MGSVSTGIKFNANIFLAYVHARNTYLPKDCSRCVVCDFILFTSQPATGRDWEQWRDGLRPQCHQR